MRLTLQDPLNLLPQGISLRLGGEKGYYCGLLAKYCTCFLAIFLFFQWAIA